MAAVSAALVARMKGDATLVAMLATFRNSPCVFSESPVPASAARGYVFCGNIVDDSPIDTKTSQIREHVRDIDVVFDATGDGRQVEAAADRIRTLFHRYQLNVDGMTTLIAKVFGPMHLESDPSLTARRVTLHLTLVTT